MACINYFNTNFALFISYRLDKTRPAQKLLVWVKFTGNSYSYRTFVNVNGYHWNTHKLAFTGTRIRVPILVLVSMWMHPESTDWVNVVHKWLTTPMHAVVHITDSWLTIVLTLKWVAFKHSKMTHENEACTSVHHRAGWAGSHRIEEDWKE